MTTPADTHERILRAALRVIGEHGIAGLTNRLVAKEAGISLGSLTYHFASQTDLLRESLLRFVDDEVARITAITETLAATVHTVEQAAAAAQHALAEMTVGREEIGVHEVYVHAARDPELYEATQRCFAAYDEVATTTLRLLGIADPERVAGHVVALIAGGQLRRLATGVDATAAAADGLLLLLSGAQWAASS